MIPEGDQGNKDELFEDLDKFFAPIQDVEWPEPEAPQSPPAPNPDAGASSAIDSGSASGSRTVLSDKTPGSAP